MTVKTTGSKICFFFVRKKKGHPVLIPRKIPGLSDLVLSSLTILKELMKEPRTCTAQLVDSCW